MDVDDDRDAGIAHLRANLAALSAEPEPPLLDDPDIVDKEHAEPTYASVKRDLDKIRSDLAAIIKRDARRATK